MESEVVRTEMVLAPTLPFKKMQTADKYPKGQSRGRQWKHLRHLLQSADAFSMPPDRPNYMNIQSPPSIYPPKRYCDLTGFEAPYVDPRTKLRYADPEVFKQIRMLPDEYVQSRAAVELCQDQDYISVANYGLLWYFRLPAASQQRNRVWDRNMDVWTW
ncbi:unnamed protein product [Miscanthus lutarioriparius]|uniref:Vps72/YL1 C-terminal domain-containing protein n=1 Tax=Miscanthus lutarioriparius TaxID=422564 RepID=A0A811QSL7_9POAL|nr:unnamed protein product [Miscanthus lutarioriparius]